MSRRHGRAVMPFGKFKGIQIRHIPADYLSWLISDSFMAEPKWAWLVESIRAEFRHRELRFELAQKEQGFREMMGNLFEEKDREPAERKVRKAAEF